MKLGDTGYLKLVDAKLDPEWRQGVVVDRATDGALKIAVRITADERHHCAAYFGFDANKRKFFPGELPGRHQRRDAAEACSRLRRGSKIEEGVDDESSSVDSGLAASTLDKGTKGQRRYPLLSAGSSRKKDEDHQDVKTALQQAASSTAAGRDSRSAKDKGAAKSLRQHHDSKRRMFKHPLKHVRRYLKEVEEQLGGGDDIPYRLVDYTCKIYWGKRRTLQRVHVLLHEILRLMLQNLFEEAALQTVLSPRAVHQCSLDNEKWDLAWLLTHLEDPFQRRRWGGETLEVEVVAAYVKALEDLEKKTRQTHFFDGAQHEEEDERPATAFLGVQLRSVKRFDSSHPRRCRGLLTERTWMQQDAKLKAMCMKTISHKENFLTWQYAEASSQAKKSSETYAGAGRCWQHAAWSDYTENLREWAKPWAKTRAAHASPRAPCHAVRRLLDLGNADAEASDSNSDSASLMVSKSLQCGLQGRAPRATTGLCPADHVIRECPELDECWAALIRLPARAGPTFIAGRLGDPDSADEEVTEVQWLTEVAVSVFLQALGESKQSGVVPIRADGFCGLRCLAYLLGMDFHKSCRAVRDRLAESQQVHGRLWHIADLAGEGWPPEMVSQGLRERNVKDHDIFLTQKELSDLCCLMLGRSIPIIELSADFHASWATGDHSMLAVAAGMSATEEDIHKMGQELHEQGFRLLVAEPSQAQCRPSFHQLQQMRPTILHSGIHFFILDASKESEPAIGHDHLLEVEQKLQDELASLQGRSKCQVKDSKTVAAGPGRKNEAVRDHRDRPGQQSVGEHSADVLDAASPSRRRGL
ncbi:unnamed protein product [Symbiodinium sp. CCMP2592]|nr:unnamed protein product [Symbiodinium sp. CCMP2592]